MNVERLNHLVTVLEGVRDARLPFNLSDWVQPTRRHACGTAACAIGYAALDPVFQAQGLTLEVSVGPAEPVIVKTAQEFNQAIVGVDYDDDGLSAGPSYLHLGGWQAVRAFFDLGDRVVGDLFSDASYNYSQDPQLVIDRVRKLVELGEDDFIQWINDGGEED